MPSTPHIIAILKKEHDDKPVDLGESWWDRISADMTPQELGVSHELFASPLMLGYALAYMVPWAMLGSL